MAEKCANRSSPPSSGVMKPKPLESLNHFTVPVAISCFLAEQRGGAPKVCISRTKVGKAGPEYDSNPNASAIFTWLILRSQDFFRVIAGAREIRAAGRCQPDTTQLYKKTGCMHHAEHLPCSADE